MNRVNNHINPSTTSYVLKCFGLAIDEIKLLRSIDGINEQVRRNRGINIDSGRKNYLISELRFLNKRLHAVRKKANIN